jgi:hypothetical protein
MREVLDLDALPEDLMVCYRVNGKTQATTVAGLLARLNDSPVPLAGKGSGTTVNKAKIAGQHLKYLFEAIRKGETDRIAHHGKACQDLMGKEWMTAKLLNTKPASREEMDARETALGILLGKNL